MRFIRVTDSAGVVYDLDIDNTTSIGIDFQAYDFKEPGKRKINISNSFTVPATIHNLRTFGYPGNVHTTSLRFYDRWYIDYWIDNVQFVNHARLRIQSVDQQSGRISLFVFEKEDVWEQMRDFFWPDFIPEFLTWMRDVKSLPVLIGDSGDWTYYTGTMAGFLGGYVGNTEGITMPHLLGNLSAYQDKGTSEFAEVEGSLAYLQGLTTLYFFEANPDDPADLYYGEGGHFCIFAKTIFEFLEYKFDLNFYTTGDTFPGNIWDDSIIAGTFTPARDISVYTGDGTTWSFFVRNTLFPGFFEPHHDTIDKPDKSLYDFIVSFIQHYNIVIDNEEGITDIKLRRFDDIEQYGTVVNWSGLAKKPIFKPYVDGYAQNSYIKFGAVYPGANEYLNAKTIVSNNKSLDPEVDLFEIDAYVPAVSKTYTYIMLDVAESFETFQFLAYSPVPDFLTSTIRTHNRTNTAIYTASLQLTPAVLVSMVTEYIKLEDALLYPEFYEVEKWLGLRDMVSFKPFNLYYFQELNGCYFVNKISGFNPDKSTAPTKLELIKINSRDPDPVYLFEFWTDGFEEVFTEGIGEKFL